MDWFRVYSEIKDDPKMLALDDHQFRIWINLLAMANEDSERGVVNAYPMRGLAAALRTDEQRLEEAIKLFEEYEMVTRDETGRRVAIAHWKQRQYDKASDTPEATRDRKRRSRARHADVASSHTPYTDTETEQTREEQQSRADAREPAPATGSVDAVAPEMIEILWLAPFVPDDRPEVEAKVRRAFALVPDFDPIDGPYLAERFANWRNYGNDPPADWFQTWLTWMQTEARDAAVPRGSPVLAGVVEDSRPHPEREIWIPYDQRPNYQP